MSQRPTPPALGSRSMKSTCDDDQWPRASPSMVTGASVQEPATSWTWPSDAGSSISPIAIEAVESANARFEYNLLQADDAAVAEWIQTNAVEPS